MNAVPHSSESSEHGDDGTESSDDPRIRSGEDDDDMANSYVDTDHNMPGDQPEDDTPPPLGAATGKDTDS